MWRVKRMKSWRRYLQTVRRLRDGRHSKHTRLKRKAEQNKHRVQAHARNSQPWRRGQRLARGSGCQGQPGLNRHTKPCPCDSSVLESSGKTQEEHRWSSENCESLHLSGSKLQKTQILNVRGELVLPAFNTIHWNSLHNCSGKETVQGEVSCWKEMTPV